MFVSQTPSDPENPQAPGDAVGPAGNFGTGPSDPAAPVDDPAAVPAGNPAAKSTTAAASSPAEVRIPTRDWVRRRVLPLALAMVAGWIVTAIGVGEVEPLRPRPDLTAVRWAGVAIATVAFVTLAFVVGRRFRASEAPGQPPRWTPFIGVFVFAAVMPLVSVAYQNHWSSAVSSAGIHVVSIIGVLLIASGVTRRGGTSRHCPGCQYEYNFKPDDGPPRCPECGVRWNGRLVLGVVERSVPRIIAGTLVLLSPFMLMFLPWRAAIPISRVPTGALITYIRTVGASEWVSDELAARTLSPKEHDEVALAMIEQRTSDSFAATYATSWLVQERFRGRLSPEVEARIRAEDHGIRLSVPRSATVGEPFPLMLYAGRRMPLAFNRVEPVGLTVDGVQTPVNAGQLFHSQLGPNLTSAGQNPPIAKGVSNRLGRVEVVVTVSLEDVGFGRRVPGPPKTIRLTREIDILPK
jgi:hypothetical protein